MISAVLIALLAAFCEASVVVKVDFIKTDTEHFDYVCPVTGYKVSGYSWSTCQEGKSRVVGCVSSTGQRYRFGERFIDHQAEWECRLEGESTILEPVACIIDGELLRVGQTIKQQRFYMQCKKAEDKSLLIDVIGCSSEEGDLVPVGETFIRGKYKYGCEDNGSEVYEQMVACVIDDTLIYVGETFVDGDYVLQCQQKGTRKGRIEVVGCIGQSGELIDSGETTVRQSVVYRCTERSSGPQLVLEPVGCFAKDYRMDQHAEYLFGEAWYDRYTETTRLRMECTQEGQLVGPTVTGCQFIISELEYYNLPVGCAKQAENYLYVCKKVGLRSVMARKKRLSSRSTLEDVLREVDVPLC